MPYCWDGHDNGLRALQTNTGVNMQRASWTPQELRQIMTALLNDNLMITRMREISDKMKKGNGVRDAALAILNKISI